MMQLLDLFLILHVSCDRQLRRDFNFYARDEPKPTPVEFVIGPGVSNEVSREILNEMMVNNLMCNRVDKFRNPAEDALKEVIIVRSLDELMAQEQQRIGAKWIACVPLGVAQRDCEKIVMTSRLMDIDVVLER
ncbi:hypothetical protein TSUD_51950 [Trifolium subterraneum]|uniref:Uncharacterized protein n=1 Tax=Trifolium subterraneum TaxID=3900 RepID=A0A2Z6LKW3_TRISU|nr:hypothetical protein TSUD_51950 [Trifolium subterraneum]